MLSFTIAFPFWVHKAGSRDKQCPSLAFLKQESYSLPTDTSCVLYRDLCPVMLSLICLLTSWQKIMQNTNTMLRRRGCNPAWFPVLISAADACVGGCLQTVDAAAPWGGAGGTCPDFVFPNIALSISWPLGWIHKHSSCGLFLAIYSKLLIWVHMAFPLKSSLQGDQFCHRIIPSATSNVQKDWPGPSTVLRHLGSNPPVRESSVGHKECKGHPDVFG